MTNILYAERGKNDRKKCEKIVELQRSTRLHAVTVGARLENRDGNHNHKKTDKDRIQARKNTRFQAQNTEQPATANKDACCLSEMTKSLNGIRNTGKVDRQQAERKQIKTRQRNAERFFPRINLAELYDR